MSEILSTARLADVLDHYGTMRREGQGLAADTARNLIYSHDDALRAEVDREIEARYASEKAREEAERERDEAKEACRDEAWKARNAETHLDESTRYASRLLTRALAAESRAARLAEALREIRDELGVPQPGYPQPVANAANIARAALAADREGGKG